MQADIEQTVQYYISGGAPGDQGVLIALLRELQQEWGGSIPAGQTAPLAALLGVKESFLLAVIRRIPGLCLGQSRELTLCAGPNCGRHSALAAAAEALCRRYGVTLKFSPCMRMCGKGPNAKFDGRLYYGVNAALLESLLKEKEAK